jgi:IS5 family transposase
MDLSEEKEVIYIDRGYFRAKSKGYDATMKRTVRGHPLGVRDLLINRVLVQKSSWRMSIVVTKGTFKAGKVLVTSGKRVNLKMMCTAFCYDLHQLRTLKIKGVY